MRLRLIAYFKSIPSRQGFTHKASASPLTALYQSTSKLGLSESFRYALVRLSRFIPWWSLLCLAQVLSRRPVRRVIPKRLAPNIHAMQRRMADLVGQQILDLHAADMILNRCCLNRIIQPFLVSRCVQLAQGSVFPKVSVTGLEPVLDCAASSHPLILLGSHFGVGRFFPGWFASYTRLSLVSIEAVDELLRMRVAVPSLRVRELNGSFPSHVTIYALRHLQNGGILHMTGDNSRAGSKSSGHRLRFGSVFRTFPEGPAYLACATNARIFFYFCRMKSLNEVHVEFYEPQLYAHVEDKHSSGCPPDVQLTRAYAERLLIMQTLYPCDHYYN